MPSMAMLILPFVGVLFMILLLLAAPIALLRLFSAATNGGASNVPDEDCFYCGDPATRFDETAAPCCDDCF